MTLSARCIVMMAAISFSCAAADDPGGWTKARWGMTEPQLIEAFGPSIVRLDPPEAVGGIPIHLAVDIALVGSSFRALLAPDKDGHLYNVLISPRQSKDRNEVTFELLENLLVEKYGRPWKSEAGHETNLQWSFATTVIRLAIDQVKEFNFCILTLQYIRKTDEPI